MEAEPDAPGCGNCGATVPTTWPGSGESPRSAQRDPKAAVAMARQMVEQCPEAEAYWNTLGAAYYRAGDDASAIAALDHATTRGGGTAFDDVFLALARAGRAT